MASIRYDQSRDSWLVDLRRGTLRKRLYFATRNEAQEFKRNYMLKKAGIPDDEPEKKLTPVQEVVERYKTTVTTTKAGNTQYFEDIVFKDFVKVFGNMNLQEIALADLQEYQARLRKKILGQSANRRFTTLCHFFGTCVDWGLLEENPTAKLKKLPATRQRAKRALTEEELKALLGAAKPWLRDVLWFILVCGLRRSQACFMRWSAIDFPRKYIHLESSEGFDNKDYEANTLPMTELTGVFLKMVLEQAQSRSKAGPNDFVFLDDRGEPLRPDRLTHEAKKLMQKVLKQDSGAVHILRHTSITMRHRQGVSLDDVRAISGHSNIRTTMLYLHSEPEHLRKELDRTPIVKPFWLS